MAYLSAAMGLAVDLVQAVPSREEYRRYLPIGPLEESRETPSYEEYAQIVGGEADSYLVDLKERLTQQGASPVETQLLHGPPADCIVDLATTTANNLVRHDHPRTLRRGPLGAGQRSRARRTPVRRPSCS